MIIRQKVYLMQLLCLLIFSPLLHAQDIVVREIPSLDKLPVNAIHRIFQDSDGYMWYGTFNGLCRNDLTFLFNSNFYCIFGHDDEVSCNGFLFHGSSRVMKLKLSPEQSANLNDIIRIFRQESAVRDNLQEEMLRIILKRFIITCTRIAREKCGVTPEQEKAFDIVRRFYILVDQHFREKKQVQDYADLLFRSPKTLSNLFASCGVPSPLRIIHERVEAEAKRLLLYTPKSAKEISELLGFEDLSTFSRFFKKMTGESVSDFRKLNTTGNIAN